MGKDTATTDSQAKKSAEDTIDDGAGDPAEEKRLPTGWRGVLAPLDTLSGDARIIKSTTTPRTRSLPLPLDYQATQEMGHDGAKVAVGRIERVWTEDGLLYGEGTFDLTDPYGAEAARKLADGYMRWVSAELDDSTDEVQCLDEDGNPGACPDDEELMALWEADIEPPRAVLVTTDWRLMGATMVGRPAFDEAQIEAVYAEGQAGTTTAGAQAAPALGCLPCQTAKDRNYDLPLIASAGWKEFRPPAVWFADPRLDGPTRPIVTDDGRVYGHAALWESCHVGFPGQCTPPPRSATSYAYFHASPLRLDSGELIEVGAITAETGHAPLSYSAKAAREHYDNTGALAAAVRAGEDRYGLWFAGCLLPGVDVDEFRFKLGRVSGDWRAVPEGQELLGILAVPKDGFPNGYARRTGELGEPVSLVASADWARIAAASAGQAPGPVERMTEAFHAAVRAGHQEDLASRVAAARQRFAAARIGAA